MPQNESDRSAVGRRALLRATAGGVVGLGAATTASAQASGSVTFADQNSDGSSVVVSEVQTSVDARLDVIKDTSGTDTVLTTRRLDAGVDLTDLTVELDTTLSETSTVTVLLFEESDDPDLLARDSGLVAVDADLDEIGVRFVEADPEAGFEYPYFLTVPAGAIDGPERPLLVEPNNTGTATDDFERHREAARELAGDDRRPTRTLADRLQTPLLVPVFPRPRTDPVDDTHYVHQLDRDTLAIDGGPLERVDRQLVAMVEDARDRLADTAAPVTDDGIVLNGFSASGNFVTRFAALHPDEVVSVTAGGINGMSVLPLERANGRELPYHVGIGDLGALTGESFADVNRFLYMGEIDVSDTIPFGDAFSDRLRETALAVFGRNMQRDRFAYTRAVYRDAGASAVFRQYEGVPHRITGEILDDLVSFHERSIAGESAASIRSDLGGNVPELGAHVEYDAVAVDTGQRVTFDGSRSSLDGATIATYRWVVDGEPAGEGPALEHAFETPGGHAVRLVVESADGRTRETVEQVVVSGGGFDVSEPALEVSEQSFAGRTLTVDRVTTDRAATLQVRSGDEFLSPELSLEADEVRESVTVDLTARPVAGDEVFVTLVGPDGRGVAQERITATEDPAVETDGLGPTLVEADPEAGFEYPYFLYAPRRYADEEPGPLVVESNNPPRPSDDFAYHEGVARDVVENEDGLARQIADSLGGALLVPVFPRPRSDPVDSQVLTTVLDADTLAIEDGPLRRIDLQLLAMMEDARTRLTDRGCPVTEETVLNGFSGSANFVDRFAALHPEAVSSVTAGGVNGMPILPLDRAAGRELPYHVGVANVEALTGEPFDREAFRGVDRLLYMGEFDDSDTIPFGDTFSDTAVEEGLRETALSVFGPHMTDDRFPYARAVYDDLDVGAAFRTYRGGRHSPRPARRDVLRFHAASLDGADSETLRARFGGAPSGWAHVRVAPRRPATGERVTLDATRSARRDATPTEYEWSFSDGRTATGPTAGHTFESAGLHAVTLTVRYDDGTTAQATEYVPVGVDTTTVVTDAPPERDDSIADRFDDGDGDIQPKEVLQVIEAYNGDDADLSAPQVLEVIAAFNRDAGWDAVGR